MKSLGFELFMTLTIFLCIMYFKREVKRCFLFVDYAQREFRKNNLYFLRHDFSRGNNFMVTFLVPGSPTLPIQIKDYLVLKP